MARGVKIIERKLGRESALGQITPEETSDLIEIDPRQDSKEYLDTVIHELLHHKFPDLDESKVTKIAKIISRKLWTLNFRRIMK